jgi:hypothetical protein
MSDISRSVFQKLAEENKRLKKDLEIICLGSLEESTKIRLKWIKHFKGKEMFTKMFKQLALEHFKTHPEYDVSKYLSSNKTKYNGEL